jgi:hypothetical protein
LILSFSLFAIASGLLAWMVSWGLPNRGVIDVPGFAGVVVPAGEPIVFDPPESVTRGLMKDLPEIPLRARPKRYRELADDAEREAAHETGSIRTSYQRIAEEWRALASAIDATSTDEASTEPK